LVVLQVLDILWNHQINFKAEKCTFGQPMVEYLASSSWKVHVEMDPVKVTGI